MSGGPVAMSADFVPGCILRLALASIILCSIVFSCWFEEPPRAGDLGPIWISVGGGGLGSLGDKGELDGLDISIVRFLFQQSSNYLTETTRMILSSEQASSY